MVVWSLGGAGRRFVLLRRLRRQLASFATSLAFTVLLAPPAAAQDPELPVHACGEAVGTFLLNSSTESGVPLSRILLALTNGGHLMFVDSAQQGEPGFAPFSDGLGRWTCLSQQGQRPRLRAVILDFTFPDDGDQLIARLDIEATVGVGTGSFTGTATLSFFPLDSDPLGGAAINSVGSLRIEGRKIEVPQ